MPDVVVIEEVQQDTLPVLLPGFSWGSLEERGGYRQKSRGSTISGFDFEEALRKSASEDRVQLFTATLLRIVPGWRQPRCPPANEWTDNMHCAPQWKN